MLFQDESENAIIYFTDEGIIMNVITQSPFLFVKVIRSFVALDSDEDKCYSWNTKSYLLLYYIIYYIILLVLLSDSY